MRDLAIIPDGAMLIEDGRIAQVGPRVAIERSIIASGFRSSTPAGAW